MTHQEIFDTVVGHLLRQGEKSLMNDFAYKAVCAYRGDYGRKCAAGVLIPDDLYAPEMENILIDSVIVYYPSIADLPAFCLNNLKLIRELQVLHDSSFPCQWRGMAMKIAAQFKLDFKF